MITIQLTNLCMNESEATERLKKLNSKFGGKTYMKLEFVKWPIGGSFDVGVRGHAESPDDLREMVTSLFTDYLME